MKEIELFLLITPTVFEKLKWSKYFSFDIKFYHQSISFELKCDNQMFSISPFLDWHAVD